MAHPVFPLKITQMWLIRTLLAFRSESIFGPQCISAQWLTRFTSCSLALNFWIVQLQKQTDILHETASTLESRLIERTCTTCRRSSVSAQLWPVHAQWLLPHFLSLQIKLLENSCTNSSFVLNMKHPLLKWCWCWLEMGQRVITNRCSCRMFFSLTKCSIEVS